MKTKNLMRRCGPAVLALAVLCTPAAVADSNTVSYQGVLRDATLSPVPDGAYAMAFSIWDDATAGTKRWGDESHPAVDTVNGMFSVYLGSTAPLGNLFSQYGALWLEISADTGAGMETYAPRVPLASVPYAQYAPRAGDANTLNGLDASAFAGASHNHDGSHITTGTVITDRLNVGTASNQVARGNHTHNTLTGPGGSPANAVVVDATGNMGVGTAAPGRRLEVNGALGFTGAGAIGGQSTGQITRAPRVIQVCDPRPGCPPPAVDNTTDLWGTNFTLANPAAIFATGTIIKFGTGRGDLGIYTNGIERQRSIADTGASGSPVTVTVMWTGVLPAGNHRISLGVNNMGAGPRPWGCGCGHGQLDILILE